MKNVRLCNHDDKFVFIYQQENQVVCLTTPMRESLTGVIRYSAIYEIWTQKQTRIGRCKYSNTIEKFNQRLTLMWPKNARFVSVLKVWQNKDSNCSRNGRIRARVSTGLNLSGTADKSGPKKVKFTGITDNFEGGHYMNFSYRKSDSDSGKV